MIGIGDPKFSLLDRAFIARNLSLLIKSGTGIAEAIGFLSNQPADLKIRNVLAKVHTDVQSGIGLSIAMEKHSGSFGTLFIRFVRIGEESGTLEETLNYLAAQYERDSDISKKIRGVLVYPAILVSVIIAYAALFSFFIFPKLQDLFADFNTPLPAITKVLLGTMIWLRQWGFIVLLILAILIIASRALKNVRSIARIREFFLFNIPGVARAYKEFMFARLFHILAFMIKSGIPIAEALNATAEAMATTYMKKILEDVHEDVVSGMSLSDSLNKFPVFPRIALKLLETAENSGSLEQTLAYLGTYYEKNIDYTSKNVSALLEPILLIVVGIAVALLAIAIILPIYQFTGSISIL